MNARLLVFQRFCWNFPRFVLFCARHSFSATKFNLYFIWLALLLLFVSFFVSLSLARSQCLCGIFFLQHLFFLQHFPSSGLEWALVVRIVCFLIFLGIIKSLLLKISLPFQFLSLPLPLPLPLREWFWCHRMYLQLRAQCGVHWSIRAYSVAFWFYFGSFHIASVNNLKSPIYNNQWKEVKMKWKNVCWKKISSEKKIAHKHKHFSCNMKWMRCDARATTTTTTK